MLTSKSIPFYPPDFFDLPESISPINTGDVTTPPSNTTKPLSVPANKADDTSPNIPKRQRLSEECGEPVVSPSESQGRLNQLVDDIGLISVQGASDPRYLGSVSGISFARVVFAAVTSTTNSAGNSSYCIGNNSAGNRNGESEDDIKDGKRGSKAKSGKEDTAMRDSFFGLATNKRRVRPAKWPSRRLANRLVDLYFGHANPQLPILHKGEFEAMVDQVYSILRVEKGRRERGEHEGLPRRKIGARELYMMNIVFAIGAGIFLEKDTGNSSSSGSSDDELQNRKKKKARNGKTKSTHGEGEFWKGNSSSFENQSRSHRAAEMARVNGDDEDNVKIESVYESEEDKDDIIHNRLGEEQEGRQYAPEAYHAAALPHLEVFLSTESKGGVEELQAVLLLAGYALLRPVAPGLWYIVGVAVRLAVDLGLHFEDSNASAKEGDSGASVDKEMEKFRGRREWIRDLRRRLWWCTYSLDRLVSTCVGRPFGIQDEVVSTRVSLFCYSHIPIPIHYIFQIYPFSYGYKKSRLK